MRQKAIFLDLDDTLLNRQKEVTPGNRQAIRRALDAGHKVVITTGRPLEASVQIAEDLGLTRDGCYLIAFNGSAVFDTYRREIIGRNALSKELAEPILAKAAALDLHMQFYDDWHTCVEPRCEEDREILWYCNRIRISYCVYPSIRYLKREPLKLLAISLDAPEKLDALEVWLDEQYMGKLNHFHSCPELVEIVKYGTDKGAAVVQLCDRLGIPLENAIACGDEANDISMIRSAGVGVAMRNGTEAARRAAGYVTERDCDHDGIAEVIERFMLSES